MNPASLAFSSSSTHRPIFSPSSIFANPLRPPFSPSSSFHTLPRRQRLCISSPLWCSTSTTTSSISSPPPATTAHVFGDNKELSGVQALVDGWSPPVRLASSALILVAAVAAGYGLGIRIGGNKNIALGAAAAVGAAGGAAVYVLNSCVPEVAAVNLHNYVVEADDPLALDSADIEAIARKFGISKQDETFNAELRELYFRFVSSVLPSGDEDLKGNEVNDILKFKSALGIDDPEAAGVHIELGRRIFRERLETGDRDADFQQRRTFQKLIYVSTLVFGEASAFLLPWKRIFGVTDAQVELAVRGNAQSLYGLKLNALGRDLDVNKLTELKESQVSYHLSDELAENMFKDHIRKLVEQHVSMALGALNSRTSTRGAKDAVLELEKILMLSDFLLSLRKDPSASRLACGIGPISLVGGAYTDRIEDLKLLYKAYLAEALSGGRIEENKLVAVNQLKNIFGLGKQEAETVTADVTSKAYRRQLSQAFSNGELEAADSKAAFLQNLCDRILFDPQKASDIHEEIYRQKLQQCIAGGVLREQDVDTLQRLRVMLCMPQRTVEAAHADICGTVFEKVVKEAVGIDSYDGEGQTLVRKSAHDLRLTRELAMSIASKTVRKIFVNYVKQAKAADNRSETVEVLDKMIIFNRLVVTRLVADIRGEPSDAKSEEHDEDYKLAEEENKLAEEDNWDSLLDKLKSPLRGVKPVTSMPWQSEITLKDDLPERERSELYKTYLLYHLTGEGSKSLIGAKFPKEGDIEYFNLTQLSGILGLTETEATNIQGTLAEKAFRQEAEAMLADGQLTKGKINHLSEVQMGIGLSAEYAQKVIKRITNSKVAAAVQVAIRQGKLNIKQIRELKEASVDVDSIISTSLREKLFKKTVDEIFSSGTGEVDEEELYKKIPADLSINADKAEAVVHERARTRSANSLVQAVALLRQRNSARVVSTLNDLLACDKAYPMEPLTWDVPGELSDLYGTYLKSNPAPEKLSRLQYLLGINDTTAAALKEVIDRRTSIETEEEFVF